MATKVKRVLPQREDLSLVPNTNIDIMWAAGTWNSSAGLQERQEGPRGLLASLAKQ